MQVYFDELRRFAWGTDAGFYRMIPQKVVIAQSEQDVIEVLREGRPVTFRAAGTSLSGQAVSSSTLCVAGKDWEKYRISDNGRVISLQPGIVGARVNKLLAPLGRKFGPDPASIGSCMVGGIVNNNASGMSCGIHANSDRMLRSARMILADGTVLDTADASSREAFAASHASVLEAICELRDSVRENAALSDRIRHKYSIKNVTGLNILPLLEHYDPFEIMAHLLVGSEGTLAFLSEVTMDTLPVPACSASAMVYFDSITDAASAVVALKSLRPDAAELLDRRSLVSVGDHTGDTAVLIKLDAAGDDELSERITQVKNALQPFKTVTGVEFSSDPAVTCRYWAIRSGIFPTVGGLRREGTTCLIEDVAFHIEDLPAATADLSALLDRHGYDDSCIYGHALEGNFHFIINQAFDSEAEVRRYEAMIRDVAELVVGKYDGSLKAEHGTGRNMAPFVEYEWGSEAFEVMKRIKKIFDPKGLLNPGVIFNDDPLCFLRDFKNLPVLKPFAGAPDDAVASYGKINKCIECGFCEVNCVSCGFTLSSRMRVALQREIASCSPERAALLRKQYKYAGEQTCAGDGLCSTSCPMGINVADMTHELRRAEASLASAGWKYAASHFSLTKNGIRTVLGAAEIGRKVLGNNSMALLCGGLHKLGLPLWTPSMPAPVNISRKLKKSEGAGLGSGSCSFGLSKVVYFPSCFNQMMGAAKGDAPLVEEMRALCAKAGYEVLFPKNMEKLCCGTIWESKGMPETADSKTAELEAALWEASEQGRWPVLCDQSPCLHRMKSRISCMELYEPAEFILKFLVPHLSIHQTDDAVAVHLTCSTRLMRVDHCMVELARLCSSRVLVPEEIGCCGFAGDKGMTHPELNKWALRKLRPQIEEFGAGEGFSNSRTCEIGLSTNSGIPYKSIVYLVNRCSSPFGHK